MATTPAGTRLQVATDAAFTALVKNYDGTYATGITTVAGELPKGVTLYCRGAHKESSLGWSAWSAVVSFMVAAYQRWVIMDNGTYGSLINTTATDGAGNLYVGGQLNGLLYIAKFDTNGNVLWQYCTLAGGYFTGIGLDESGNVYAVGCIASTYTAIYLIKLTNAGGLVWHKYATWTHHLYLADCAVDSTGNMYTVGSIPLGGVPGSGGMWYTLISKWATDGTLVWQKYLASGSYNLGSGICADTNGNIYLVGYVDINGDNAVGYLVKMTTAGALTWVRRFNSASPTRTQFSSVVVSPDNNNIVVFGTFSSTPFITKWAADGTLVWQRNVGIAGRFNGGNIDSDGNIYAFGALHDGTDYRAYLTKWSLGPGSLLWGRRIASSGAGNIGRSCMDTTGTVYAGGLINSRAVLFAVPPSGLPLGVLPSLTGLNVVDLPSYATPGEPYTSTSWGIGDVGLTYPAGPWAVTAQSLGFTKSAY